MPELPDIEVYLHCLRPRILGQRLEQVRLKSPFLLRTVDPPITTVEGKRVTEIRRLGKRIVIVLEQELFLVLHLMIAGRMRWAASGSGIPGKVGQAALDYPPGSLILTEAGTKKRASLHLVRGEADLAAHDPRGLEVLEADLEAFRGALQQGSHTIKRALTDPRILSGIGNAYSDEILHRARLSPFKLTGKLTGEELERLYSAARGVLREYTERIKGEVGEGFPEKVTAFRDDFAVHGRYKKPCPRCGAPVQRIVYAQKHDANYCARCQTGGRLLADRALSRLLKGDWPKTLEELE
jgi:formamidopyrimidine-DNA glycosylase